MESALLHLYMFIHCRGLTPASNCARKQHMLPPKLSVCNSTFNKKLGQKSKSVYDYECCFEFCTDLNTMESLATEL